MTGAFQCTEPLFRSADLMPLGRDPQTMETEDQAVSTPARRPFGLTFTTSTAAPLVAWLPAQLCHPRRRDSANLVWSRVRTDLQLHAIRIAEEQRPLTAEALDLTDLRARGHHPLAQRFKGGARVHGEPEVIDRPSATSKTFRAAPPPRSTMAIRGWSSVAAISKVTLPSNAAA
jgi:hypothetical protein